MGRDSPSQFPTAEVNGEMRLPHGSDWSSIRDAGRKPSTVGTRPAGSREQVAMGSASERPSIHRYTYQAYAGYRLAQNGKGQGPAAVEPTGIHPDETRWKGRPYGYGKRTSGTK